MFEERYHYDFGRLARREAHEPCIIRVLLPLFALQEFVRGKLGGAGLAAHVEARKLRAAACAALVHHAPGAIDHFGHIVRRNRPTVFLILAALDQVRLMPQPAVDEPAISARQLQGRHRHSALADGHRDGFAGIPFLAEVADLPGRRRHHAFGFVGQVDTGLFSQSGLVGVEGDLIDPGAFADIIEVDVGRLHDASMQRNGAMATLQVALMIVAVKRCTTRTMDRELVVDRARLKTRYGHDGLEGGPGRILRLNGAIQERMIGVIGDFPPVGRLDALRKLVGVETGSADHRQDLPGARVHGDNRAILAFHGELGDGLQIEIEGQLQVFARNGFFVGERFVGLAAVIHHHLALAIHAHQGVIVLALDAELADHGALAILRVVGRIQFLLADFAGIADDVRGKSVLRVKAALRMDQFHLGKEIAVRIDKCQLAGRELLFDDDRIVFWTGRVAPDARGQVVVIQVQSVGDGSQMFGLQVFAGEDEAVGGMVIDDDAAVAVQNFAAGRGNG